MNNQLLHQILKNCTLHSNRNAFFIQNKFYTYGEFAQKIAGISEALLKFNSPQQTVFGVITTDSIETYASIIALWINGYVFVPLSPVNSAERNQSNINQTNIKNVLVNSLKEVENIHLKGIAYIETEHLSSSNHLEINNTNSTHILYILFTSGSTGIPKGVPISLKNLETFIVSFLQIGFQLTYEDKFLQIYDLSFDASVHCYTLPLFLGGCVYTVPLNEVKYLYAYKLMKEQELTFVKVPPSTLSYLRPFFSKIKLEKMKYMLFGGEALPLNLIRDWQNCAPNAEIHNVYGPTEATINCFCYKLPSKAAKQFNSVVCIGKPFGDSVAVVVDENLNPLPANQKGELCVSGNQITTGYWKNPKKNKVAFVELMIDNQKLKFYRTGDLVYFDEQNDYFYCGRIDNQVQIQGYRVEMGEIEHHVRIITNASQVVALTKENTEGILQIFLLVENDKQETDEIKSYLKEKLPAYMQPVKIIAIEKFPLSTSGKVDREKLKELL
ncbi:MAG: AMP-binding protein [Vicingaceae bacterium]|nr:AMP-binding protein [Vicingaceae bacterium]